MTNILTDPRDQLKGIKIYAKFRKKVPQKKPTEVRNDDGSLAGYSYKLMKSVICIIEKSYRKK